MFNRQIKSALLLLVTLTMITGVVYPLVITVIGQLVFPRQANGSIVMHDGKPVGSTLIGQEFSNPKYFWGRPSATSPTGYNPLPSSGSNFGPLNPALRERVEMRVKMLQSADPENKSLIPVDIVTASASGLDPHISLAGALYQVPRVARARGVSRDKIVGLVKENTTGRFAGVFGEPVVNVLQLNVALDQRAP
jgi:K+-transporting ATPase ATPase C chain